MKLINLFLRYFREKYSFLKQGNLVTFYKFNISENNQEIVSKSGLMASRASSRRRAEAGPVEVLNQWGDARRQRIRPYAIIIRDCRHRGPPEDRHS